MDNRDSRCSNIELFRIILMIVIISHHYVVNSGLTELYSFDNVTSNMLFLQIVGGWGKTAIDCFLLITGYYTCVQEKTNYKKWINICLEVLFYGVIINLLFLMFKYTPLGIFELIKGMIGLPVILSLKTGEDSFVSIYMVLFLLIPYINKLIRNLSAKEYKQLLLILFAVFSFKSTFMGTNWEGVSWYVTVYLIGAYLRLHPIKWDNFKCGLTFSCILIFAALLNIIIVDITMAKFGRGIHYYHFIMQANSCGSILIAISLFIMFKNIKIKQSKIINRVASTTLGVLLIHANSGTMRQFLWKDLLKNTSYYNAPFIEELLHWGMSVVLIYAVCVIIDFFRQFLFNRINKQIA